MRTCRPCRLRPAGRGGCGAHGQQRAVLPALRGEDHREPGQRRSGRRDDPVPGRAGHDRERPARGRRHDASRSSPRPSRTRDTSGWRASRRAVRAGPATAALKPDVTAPGVSIASAGMGTGTGLPILSGTSMAAPHTAGVAALVEQAHPSWKKVEYWKAAIVNTADPGKVLGSQVVRSGSFRPRGLWRRRSSRSVTRTRPR